MLTLTDIDTSIGAPRALPADADNWPVDWVVILLIAVHMVVVVLLIIMARGGATGWLRRNGWFGIRTPQSLGSDQAWRRVHRHAAPWSYIAASILSVAVLLMILVHQHETTFFLTLLVGDMVVAILLGVATWKGLASLES